MRFARLPSPAFLRLQRPLPVSFCPAHRDFAIRTMSMITPLRDALTAGKTAYGVWNTLPGTAVVRTIAGTPGISWVLIDAEHGQLNDTHIYTHALAVASAGVSPLVRLPVDDGSGWWTKRALDAGAHGIMVPLVHDAARARAVVAQAKYPPRGIRGFGPMFTHTTFGPACTAVEYKAGADDKLLVIIQIESKQAVDNLEEIAQVEGLDVLFIGPFDLSLSLGVAFGSDAHNDAIAKVLSVSHKHGKKVAIYCTNGEQARIRAAQGFDMISVATDFEILAQSLAEHVATASNANPETLKAVGGGYKAN